MSPQPMLMPEIPDMLMPDWPEMLMPEIPDMHPPTTPDPLAFQVGGNHYKTLKIQPIEYIHANNIGYCEGSVIKYVTRWRTKNGVDDLRKAIHFLELLISLEEANTP